MVDPIDRVLAINRLEDAYNDVLIWDDEDDWNRGIKEGIYIAMSRINALPTIQTED